MKVIKVMEFKDVDPNKSGVDNSIAKWEYIKKGVLTMRRHIQEKCGLCWEYEDNCEICPFGNDCVERKATKKPRGAVAQTVVALDVMLVWIDRIEEKLQAIKKEGNYAATHGDSSSGGG